MFFDGVDLFFRNIKFAGGRGDAEFNEVFADFFESVFELLAFAVVEAAVVVEIPFVSFDEAVGIGAFAGV